MKNGYTKIFFSDPKSADFTQSKYKPSNNSEGHEDQKIVPIFLKSTNSPRALTYNFINVF